MLPRIGPPPKGKSLAYCNAWMRAVADLWKWHKARRGSYRRINKYGRNVIPGRMCPR